MKRVLILEDEPVIAMDLTLAFEDQGAWVLTTGSCEEALDAIARDVFDGAVLDVNLGGSATSREAALELQRRRIPFVLNTGDLDRAGEFLRRMNAPVIRKPTAANEVARALLALT